MTTVLDPKQIVPHLRPPRVSDSFTGRHYSVTHKERIFTKEEFLEMVRVVDRG